MNDFLPLSLMTPPTRIALQSRREFREGLVEAVVGACVEGRREMIWVDANFADWPLDDARLLDTLTRWSRQPMRKLQIIARSFDDVPRRHPRFTTWRRTYGHRVDCRSAPDLSDSEMPSLMLAGDLYSLQLLDKRHWSGRWLDDETEQKAWREVVDAILQRSDADFGASTLGL